MRNNLRIAIVFALVVGFTSCNEAEFLREEPRSNLVVDELYTSPVGFQTALNGVYGWFRQFERDVVPGAVNESMMGRLIAAGTDYMYFPIYRNQELPWVKWGDYSHSSVADYNVFFRRLYQIVRAANVIVNRAEFPEAGWDSEEQKNMIVAEARLLRTWAYRHLTFLWGDVPLITDEITGDTYRNDWERTPKAEIFDFMEADLLFAEAHLPPVQQSAGSASSAVAQHYLAELYLMKGRPDLAEEKAQAAIDNPNYRLITERYGVKADQPGVPFMDAFYAGNALYSQGNTEGLWNLPFGRNIPGGGGNRMRRGWLLWYRSIPGVPLTSDRGRGQGWYGINKHGLDLYEEQDDRASEFAIHRYVVKENGDTVFTTTNPDEYMGQYEIGSFPATAPDRPYNWPSTRKWDDAFPEDLSAHEGYKNQPYLRLAETYLLLAEAQHLQGKNELAAQNINTVRRRSNASEIMPSDVSITFILEERMRELFAEEHRRHTLLRLGLWFERTKQYNEQAAPFITERDTLYPIPQSVIDANIDRQFPQNPGYE